MADEPTLSVWCYDSVFGAAAGELRLTELRKRKAITVHDAITVTWMPGAHRPRVGHLRHQTSASAASGSMLGALALILLQPMAGEVADATIRSLAQRLRGTGIDEDLLVQIRCQLLPGTSLLLVLSSDADMDVVRPVAERGLARGDVRLLHASLSEKALDAIADAAHALQEEHRDD